MAQRSEILVRIRSQRAGDGRHGDLPEVQESEESCKDEQICSFRQLIEQTSRIKQA